MPREVVLPPVNMDPLELAPRLFSEDRERRDEPAHGRGRRSVTANASGETEAGA